MTMARAQIVSGAKAAANNKQLFQKVVLSLMNKYRLMHAAAPLQLSQELTKKADTWASQLANQDKEKINVNSKYGQNIFSSEDQENLAARCVRSWYNGIRFYDFHTAKSSLRSEYFTQLVWVASQEVGIGKAISASGKTYVVALFDPPGNKGEYLHNVKPVSGTGVGKRGPSKCPDGYKLYNNVCYKYFPGPVNWVQASEKCTEQFSSLASIESQAEDFFIRTVVTSGGASDAWIGISDLNNAGIMSWLDGTPNQYMNWDYSQRNFPGKKCGVIATNFNWKYKPCDKAQGFICKRPLRGLSRFIVIIRYDDKLWTDNLYYPASPRYQALSRHIQEAILAIYGDFDWFEEVSLDHFSKGEDDKIVANVKLSFTPDDDSPSDPILFLREAIRGGGNSSSPQRSEVPGILHGEKVKLVNATLLTGDQVDNFCPAYCAGSQCVPAACSPWCCDSFGQQYLTKTSPGRMFGIQQQQPPQQLGYSSSRPQSLYNPVNQIPAFPPQRQFINNVGPPFKTPLRRQYLVLPQQVIYQPPSTPQPQYSYQVRAQPPPYQVSQQHQYGTGQMLQQAQYPMLLRPQLSSLLIPARRQENRYPFPPQPQPVQSQIISNPPQRSPQYLVMPPASQVLYQAPQAYQPIPRPMNAPSWPAFTLPSQQPPMLDQVGPQFLPIAPNKKNNQGPAFAKSPVQLQGMVFTYPYTPQASQPVPVPPMYIPPRPYQPKTTVGTKPTGEHPKKHSNGTNKQNDREKDDEPSGKSHEKFPQLGPFGPVRPQGYGPQGYGPQGYGSQGYVSQGYLPQLYAPQGYAPQRFSPSFPEPAMTSPQTSWRIRLYRPFVTIQQPPPVPVSVLNQGYSISPPSPIPGQTLQPVSPSLQPLGGRSQTPQVMSPYSFSPQFFPPITSYRPQPMPLQAYSMGGQLPQNIPRKPTQGVVELKTCPPPCPNFCAPACNPVCCNDRRK